VLMVGLALAALVAGIAWAAHQAPDLQGCLHGKGLFAYSFKEHAMVRDFVSFKVDRALKAVDATEEQRDQIDGILRQAFEEHAGAVREKHREMRAWALRILSADAIDHEALEALRTEHVRQVDQRSRRVVGLLEQALEILTPEQRRRLAEQIHGQFE
jgi:Spy/CpxP family protein refolding chaperone